LHTWKKGIIELINQICLEIRILNSAHVIKSFDFYQFFTSGRLEVCWYSNNGGWNASIWNILNQLFLSSNWIITNVCQHNNSMLVIIKLMGLFKTIDILQSFSKASRNGCPSTFKLRIDKFLYSLWVQIFYKLTWNDCSRLGMKDNKWEDIVWLKFPEHQKYSLPCKVNSRCIYASWWMFQLSIHRSWDI
jgi:hypothetical protein